jgi:hypothetical protein
MREDRHETQQHRRRKAYREFGAFQRDGKALGERVCCPDSASPVMASTGSHRPSAWAAIEKAGMHKGGRTAGKLTVLEADFTT